VRIKEISIVVWPAYSGAMIEGIYERTKIGERRHAASVAEIAMAKHAMAEAAERLARRRW